ncbi:MAG TPA: mechanosensitive ion channel domain-containing protein [Cytophaga sp.]|jgi:small-conductance mechanosensitive channel|nr:mechanosensitive ion channel domain-containing protein [Cytophaga sp.]
MSEFITYWSNHLFGKFQSVFTLIIFAGVGYILSIFFYKSIEFLLIRLSGPNYKSISKNFKFSLRFFTTVASLNIGLEFTNFHDKTSHTISKILFILMVISLAYILIRIIQFIKDILYVKFDVSIAGNLNQRRARTQVDFLQKIGTAFIVFVCVAIVLMSFERVRELGTSLLASAGIAGIIIGFAAQKSLGNLLAGFQIAFTQPMRYDDVVIVQGQYGRVEEITLTYVVVKLWDERRLIIPISYFIDNTFENWTRTSSEMLGTVILYTDFSMPIEPMRSELKRLLENEGKALWDGKVAVVQITDVTEQSMQVRILVSALTSGLLFDLRCLVREKIMHFIIENYPNSLPVKRILSEPILNPTSGLATSESTN